MRAKLIPAWLLLCVTMCDVAAAGEIGLSLEGYRLTFDEEFDRLDVSAMGPGTRWIAHTPWNGDFGDAQFSDPTPDFPFTVADGLLRIEAKKEPDGKWRSGLLASTDPVGRGFTQKFGYFEMRAKLPSGPGLWPAFWLIANKAPNASAEIDVLEHYGAFPDAFQSVVHVWPKMDQVKAIHETHTHRVPAGSLYSDFHNYGVLVEAEWTRFYFDRMEIWSRRTPVEHHEPMFVLLNLAMGGGWPIKDAPSPSYMYVDYVKVYQKE